MFSGIERSFQATTLIFFFLLDSIMIHEDEWTNGSVGASPREWKWVVEWGGLNECLGDCVSHKMNEFTRLNWNSLTVFCRTNKVANAVIHTSHQQAARCVTMSSIDSMYIYSTIYIVLYFYQAKYLLIGMMQLLIVLKCLWKWWNCTLCLGPSV